MSATALTPIAGRFAWKEYRMLRGFWLAVAGLTVIEQWLSTVLAPPGSNVPSWLFGSALFAAALYAVGAAATSFAVEHEEETYDFLSGLPSTWPAVFIGKLLVTLGSAFALAAVLTLTGLALGGPPWSRSWPLVGLFGAAIFEAVAWGTLFSLLVKRPLVAAVLTLLVTTLAIHLAVNATGDTPTASIRLSAYNEAIPLRLTIVAGVLLLCALLARRWLAVGPRPARAAGQPSTLKTIFPTLTSPIAGAPLPRRRMFARLLWQTWCESWKMLFVPLLVAAGLYLVIVLISVAFPLTGDRDNWLAMVPHVASALFLPALFGSLIFHADQRRRQYRFLAEHAAGARWVWLARHVVWLGSPIVLLFIVSYVAGVAVALLLQHGLERYTVWGRWRGEPTHQTLDEMRLLIHYTLFGLGSIGFGALVAYGIGQLCSMLLRSAIIAVFLALVLSIVATSWSVVVLLWGLSGWLFLMPLAVGLLAATWLRAPDWIAEHSSWRGWWKPATALTAPIVLVAVLLPIMRLRQLPAVMSVSYLEPAASSADSSQEINPENLSAEDRATLEKYYQSFLISDSWRERGLNGGDRPAEEVEIYEQGTRPFSELVRNSPDVAGAIAGEANRRLMDHREAEARQTGDMYLKAADMIAKLHDWRKSDPLDTWHELHRSVEREFDASKLSASRQDSYRQAVQEHEKRETALKLLLEASRRPTCRFDFDWSAFEIPTERNQHYDYYEIEKWAGVDTRYAYLSGLARGLPHHAPADEAVDYYIEELRMCAHLRQHVPAVAFVRQLRAEQAILADFARWALKSTRTDAELRDAQKKLAAFLASDRLRVADSLAVDRALVRDVITGRLWPLALSQTPMPPEVYLAYLANQLPWERDRALRALELITVQNVRDANSLLNALRAEGDIGHNDRMHEWLQLRRGDYPFSPWLSEQRAAATSYLARWEFEIRVPEQYLFTQLADTETYRHAALIQIALAHYRLEHDKYPATLAELVPDYLDELPTDPYSGQPFEYRPEGLDLPLRVYYPKYQQITAYTPLVWSVGPANSRWIRQDYQTWEPESDDSDAASVEVRESVYVSDWEFRPMLVFPLPKD